MADNNTVKMWQEAASASKDCLPVEVLERFMENANAPADAKAAAHLSSCAHCQTELAMLKRFETAEPSANEGAAVAWIAAKLQRQQGAPANDSSVARVSFWRTMFRVPYLAAAAALALVLALGISLYNSDSGKDRLRGPDMGTTYRSGEITLLSPTGDLAQAPGEFRWEAVPGAASYTVELADVLGTSLASASSTQPVLEASPQMKAIMLARKPIKWKVTARDASGKVIAQSSGGSFKIK
jgi:hypothetical protein